jgi:cobalt-zinc-cadmium resistance protein CzcA
MIAIFVSGRVQETESFIIRALKLLYLPALATAVRSPIAVITAAIFLCVGAALLFARLGQEFTPTQVVSAGPCRL